MSAVIAVLLIFAVVVAFIMAFLFGWARYGSDKGTHAGPRRPARPEVATIPVKATASQPPAAITDAEPDGAAFFPAWRPWDTDITWAVPSLRAARSLRAPRAERGEG